MMMSLGVNTAKVRGNHLMTDKTIQRNCKFCSISKKNGWAECVVCSDNVMSFDIMEEK